MTTSPLKEKLVPFLSQNEIRALIKELGSQITQEYQTLLKADEELLVIVTLKGALLFGADLIREIKVPLQVDFVRVASYGRGTKSSGSIHLLKDLEQAPEEAHILILDEIVDSGRTLEFLVERLKTAKPKSLKVCTLLNKPSRREVKVNVDFIGRDVEDKFLVGYGLDYAERFRNLGEIYVLEN